MHDILAQIENLTRETAFEGEFVSMQAKTDATGRLWVEVRTRPKMRPFEVRVGNDDIERRRFTTNHHTPSAVSPNTISYSCTGWRRMPNTEIPQGIRVNVP